VRSLHQAEDGGSDQRHAPPARPQDPHGFWRLFAQHVVQPPQPPSDERLQEYTRYFRYLSRPTYADTAANGVIIAGAPDTVARRLREVFALT
jgi:hypothetical protein